MRSRLGHFALINYALPPERLAPHIPADRFEIPLFNVGGRKLALMSAVPFLDLDFHSERILPFMKFVFAQTNYRVYVTDRRTGEHAVWFFGTTLGSLSVFLPRWLWKMPWHFARYQLDCRYQARAARYDVFRYAVESRWAPAEIELEDSGEPVTRCEGFSSLEEIKLILTHPVDGYFQRHDGELGHYSVWHEEMRITQARPKRLYFGLYERMNLLSRQEMARPHSAFLCLEIEFRIHLPPRREA